MEGGLSFNKLHGLIANNYNIYTRSKVIDVEFGLRTVYNKVGHTCTCGIEYLQCLSDKTCGKIYCKFIAVEMCLEQLAHIWSIGNISGSTSRLVCYFRLIGCFTYRSVSEVFLHWQFLEERAVKRSLQCPLGFGGFECHECFRSEFALIVLVLFTELIACSLLVYIAIAVVVPCPSNYILNRVVGTGNFPY